MTVSADPDLLVYKNTFTSGSTGILFGDPSGNQVLLQENSYSGFDNNYSGTASDPIGVTPYDAFYLTSVGGRHFGLSNDWSSGMTARFRKLV